MHQCHFCFPDVDQIGFVCPLHHVETGWASLESELDLAVQWKEFALVEHVQVRFSYQRLDGVVVSCNALCLSSPISETKF